KLHPDLKIRMCEIRVNFRFSHTKKLILRDQSLKTHNLKLITLNYERDRSP
ncbi:MAG: hypothetical protein LiPW39_428, partial [Parcubacteria group bacterium LiPW_39]